MDVFKDVVLLSKVHRVNACESPEDEVSEQKEDIIEEDCKELERKVVAVYFGASWCPACQEFTPILIDIYNELSKRNAPFEVVAIPFERTKEICEQHYLNEHGDWMTVKFDDPVIGALKEKFNVTVIPKLVVLRPDGEVVTLTGRKDVQDKGIVAFRSWLNATSLTSTFSF